MKRIRLISRVYLFGVLLLLSAGATVFVIGNLLFRATHRPEPPPLLTWVLDTALPAGISGEEVRRQMERLKLEARTLLSLYDAQGALIHSTQQPPHPPITPKELETLKQQRVLPLHPVMRTAIGRFSGSQLVGYAVISPPRRPEFPTRRLTMDVLLVLLVLALVSIPFARSLTKPLEHLAATARQVGAGNLSARALIKRRDEVGDVARAFNEMAERVEELLRAEKELLANVSHELRTPLARIRVVLDLAKSDSGAAQYLPEIATDLAELEQMVDDILTAARLNLAEGRLGGETAPLRMQPTDVRHILASAVARFTDRHPERELTVDVPSGLPIVLADRVMLRRAISNLLENAHKYSGEKSSIELCARCLAQTQRASADGVVIKGARCIEIAIADRGIGIEPEDLKHIFTPFFRTDRSRARKTGGVGLGLALARRIARAHGGDLELQSRAGKGTKVTVRLPLHRER